MQYNVFVLLVILALSIIAFFPNYAFSETRPLTVKVDKPVYCVDEYVRVSGTVAFVLENVPVTVQIFNPNNTSYTTGTAIPNGLDGTYSFEFLVRGELGVPGIYTVKATYVGQVLQTTFLVAGPSPSQLIPNAEIICKIYKLSHESQVFKIPYKITNGEIKNIRGESAFAQMIVDIESDPINDGVIEITIPRNLVDTTIDHIDDDFIVLLDDQETMYEEVSKSPCFRTVSIKFPAGSKEVEVIGVTTGIGPWTVVPPVYVTTNKNNYLVGEDIKISGCTSLALDDKEVILEVLNPDGEIYQTISVTPNRDGSFSASLRAAGELAVTGAYTVKATYAGYTYVPEFPVLAMIVFAIAVSLVVALRPKSKHLSPNHTL